MEREPIPGLEKKRCLKHFKNTVKKVSIITLWRNSVGLLLSAAAPEHVRHELLGEVLGVRLSPGHVGVQRGIPILTE